MKKTYQLDLGATTIGGSDYRSRAPCCASLPGRVPSNSAQRSRVFWGPGFHRDRRSPVVEGFVCFGGAPSSSNAVSRNRQSRRLSSGWGDCFCCSPWQTWRWWRRCRRSPVCATWHADFGTRLEPSTRTTADDWLCPRGSGRLGRGRRRRPTQAPTAGTPRRSFCN